MFINANSRRMPAAKNQRIKIGSKCDNLGMSTQPRRCPHSDIDHVRPFVAYAKATLNNARYYPPLIQHKYMVALALYSKAITVAEATMALLDAGFPDEAFGMT